MGLPTVLLIEVVTPNQRQTQPGWESHPAGPMLFLPIRVAVD
jgi:hypothetical protein